MATSTIYARIPSEIKDKILEMAKATGKQQGETITDILSQGLQFPEEHKKLSQTQASLQKQEELNRTLTTELEKVKTELRIARQTVDVAERAKGHLQRVLNTQIGTCTVQDCGAPINLYGFAYQQCPHGHTRTIKLFDEYQSAKGAGDFLVAGLAVIGGVALAAELLGDKSLQ